MGYLKRFKLFTELSISIERPARTRSVATSPSLFFGHNLDSVGHSKLLTQIPVFGTLTLERMIDTQR